MTTRHPRKATTLSVVLALVGSVSLLAGSAHGQAAVTVFASCTGTITISAPGHYKLDGGATRALACPAAVAPGFRITASRVHLDLGATRFSRTNGTVTTHGALARAPRAEGRQQAVGGRQLAGDGAAPPVSRQQTGTPPRCAGGPGACGGMAAPRNLHREARHRRVPHKRLG